MKLINNEKGLSLPLVMSIIVIITIFVSALVLLSQKASYSSKREEQKQKTLYVAEAGINNYLFRLNNDPNYFEAAIPWQNYGQGQYKIDAQRLTDVVGVELTATSRIDVKNDGQTNYQTRKVKATIQKRSFLNYIYFTDREVSEGTGSPIWFITGDIIRGQLHTNDYLNVKGTPVFRAKVTTARTINYYTSPQVDQPDFQQGYEENVERLDLPTTNNELKTWSQNGGYYYYGSTTITFNSNGSIDIQNGNSASAGPTGINRPLPGNGVIYVDGQTSTKYRPLSGNIFIQGTLNGRLTIASKADIYITGSIQYNNRDTDMLGLIAENFLYINHFTNPDSLPPTGDAAAQNITIEAALASLNHSFTFEKHNYSPVKGTLTVYGSIVQRFRGPVGTFSRTTGQKLSGYTKDYNYDQRMQYDQPPHFIDPINAGFYVSSWEEI